MRFKIGMQVRVVNPYSGGNFADGDIVTIEQIGDEDGFNMDCYGALSPYDGSMWYLSEDEVAPLTNADKIRCMTNEELGIFLSEWAEKHHAWMCDGTGEVLNYLQSEE